MCPGDSRRLAAGHGAERVRTRLKAKRFPKEVEMNLSAPKMITWLVALVVGVVGILIHVGSITIVAVPFGLGFWLVAVAFVLLLVATLMKGL
jgi:type IV secretory pathway TrbD component